MATQQLYGRSDLEQIVVSLPNGDVHRHDFRKAKERFAMPGYGNEERTLPVLKCDNGECRKWALSQGFSPRADSVERTSDEIEWQERAEKDGDMYSKLMAAQFGDTLAKLAAQGNIKVG